MKPHKHAYFIKAWADGYAIEFRWPDSEWKYISHPRWEDDCEYRIFKEKQADVVQEWCASVQPLKYPGKANLKLTFDGETGELKSAEVLC